MATQRLVSAALAAVLALSLATMSGCGPGKPAAPATTSATNPVPTPATTARTRSTVPRPTTTVWTPSAPQPSPDAAAADLISKWSLGDRAGAATIAAPAAVAALFSQSYPDGNLQFRGCTSGINPATCTYRNTLTDGLYEIGVTQRPSGWYVSSVTVET